MIPDHTLVLEEATIGLERAMTEEHGLLDEVIELFSGPRIMWRDRVEHTFKAVMDRADMSEPIWSVVLT
jgi:hypothetical protein